MFVKKRRYFPNPETHSIDGIVAMGDHLSRETLLEAYSFGIFPWPHDDLPLLWYSPDPRGVLEFKDFHLPASFKKFLRKTLSTYEVSWNQAFHQVIYECAQARRKGQAGTWIHEPIRQAYLDFHRAGFAHSIEIWREQDLVGGLYGVYVGGVFAGESMFFREPNMSKLALYLVVEKLKISGLTWMDIQMVTPVTEAFGGKYISRRDFFLKLEQAKREDQDISFTRSREKIAGVE